MPRRQVLVGITIFLRNIGYALIRSTGFARDYHGAVYNYNEEKGFAYTRSMLYCAKAKALALIVAWDNKKYDGDCMGNHGNLLT